MVKQRLLSTKYPKSRRDKMVVDFYHDMKITDPYRWLEDPHSVDTKDFVIRQNELTNSFLHEYEQREQIQQKLKSIINVPRRSAPVRCGTKYFQKRNDGSQNQDVLYVTESHLGTEEGWVFLDPNAISPDGFTALKNYSFSPTMDHMAYGISIAGSEWTMVKIRNTRTGEDLPETLYKIRNSILSWNKQGTGFFYSGYLSEKEITYFGIYTKLNQNQKLYFHKLNEDQDMDVVISSFDDPSLMQSAVVSNCGNYLIISVFKTCRNNSIYIANLPQNDVNYNSLDSQTLIDNFENSYVYVSNVKNKFLFLTDNGAPNFRLVAIKLTSEHGEEMVLSDVIPEHRERVLKWVKPINHNHLVGCYLIDALDHLMIFTSDGLKMMDVNIIQGSITEISGEHNHDEMFFSVTNFFTPNIVYRLNFAPITPEISVVYETKLNFNVKDQITQEKFHCVSKDGTLIPMNIYHRKDFKLNGKSACVICLPTKFGETSTPVFRPEHLLLILNYKCVCVFPLIRGGSEFGRDWQSSGTRKFKQKSFEDFLSCAKHLIDHKYTNANFLSIYAESIGALTAAVCINKKPGIFSSAILSLGLMDMLRYDKFTSAGLWASEFGVSENKEDFDVLVKYSPLHNIRAPKDNFEYPSVFLVTADHDDVVVPAHSLKYAAALQFIIGELPNQTKPLLVKVEQKAGHGSGKPTIKRIEEAVDALAFLARTLNIKFHE